MLDVCLMGCGGSIPKPDRWLSSVLMRHGGTALIIDCGEGTQLAMKEAGFAAGKISLILLTHFHADHVSGLPGMLLSMANEGRVDPVTIAGPKGCARIVSSLCVIAQGLPFQVTVHEFTNTGGQLPDYLFMQGTNSGSPMTVTAFPARHSMPTLGYRISLPRAGKFDPARAKAAGIPVKLWGVLQRGECAVHDGALLTPDMVLGEARRGIDVSYVTDSRPTDAITAAVADSDLFICEGMFADDKAERAVKSRHMTSREAATIAKEAGVHGLWLTHYSPSMPDPSECLSQAREVFPEAVAGHDGMTACLRFPD